MEIHLLTFLGKKYQKIEINYGFKYLGKDIIWYPQGLYYKSVEDYISCKQFIQTF